MRAILFDWGDTLMRVFPEYTGAMLDWPRVAAVEYAADVLAELHPYTTLAVATNAKDSTETEIWEALKRADLAQHLDYVFCFRTIGCLKPSPEYYTYILNKLKLPPEQVIMVGDEWKVDIQGAVQAGLRAVWLNTRTPEDRSSEQCQTIHSWLDLPGVLRQWRFID